MSKPSQCFSMTTTLRPGHGEFDGWHVIIEGDLANLDTDEKDVADQGQDIRDSVQIEHFGELSDVLRVAGPRGECPHRQEVFWRELVAVATPPDHSCPASRLPSE
jgi:hypothetical protein